MNHQSKLTRRNLTKCLGLAAGSSLVAPALANSGSKLTPPQTEGPFYPVNKQDDLDADLTRISGVEGHAKGEVILVQGQVLGLNKQPVAGALVDVWQANHDGKYIHPNDNSSAPLDPNFQGWAKVETDSTGRYSFKTIRPGAYRISPSADAGIRCSHIHFKVSQAGFSELTSQMYFAGDPLIKDDIVMADTPEAERERLIADAKTDGSNGLPVYSFDIFLDIA
jgi:protocatechuate 3,4-dioxygenase beta subunit